MYTSLKQCQNHLEGIQAIDFFLAREICHALKSSRTKAMDDLLFHSIMATSQALREGHTCLKLTAIASNKHTCVYWSSNKPIDDRSSDLKNKQDQNKAGYQFPLLDDWHNTLVALSLQAEAKQPLVYENKRLYLRRYWQFEDELGSMLYSRLQQMVDSHSFDNEQAKKIIQILFPKQASISNEIDWQKIAVANALIHPMSIIAGGPGTGKTFTVTKLLLALQYLAPTPLRMALLAPTGKAAQRLNESIQKAKRVLSENPHIDAQYLATIPENANTVHRLLGVIPQSHDFRYGSDNHLPFDVILVDEVSMVDLALMTRLLRAVETQCRIIFLGDSDQLASVSVGSILADLMPEAKRQANVYSQRCVVQLSDLTDVDFELSEANGYYDYLTVLQKSYRFDGSGEIGNLAKKVISGDAKISWQYLSQAKKQIALIDLAHYQQWLDDMVEYYYVPIFSAIAQGHTGLKEAIAWLKQFRFLAATRKGKYSVRSINDGVEQRLRQKGLIVADNDYYAGRPIMVTQNHYKLNLYNGDMGLLWPDSDGKLYAVFPEGDNDFRWLSLGRLPKVETVYAMTIHKTQGSEFDHVALVLPEQDSPLLSRELLYTAITRASKQLSVYTAKTIFIMAVKHQIQRYSGLRNKAIMGVGVLAP